MRGSGIDDAVTGIAGQQNGINDRCACFDALRIGLGYREQSGHDCSMALLAWR